eukprot:TRINITY_DN684_c0_g1_i2.p1 TRINITY_DN684_c0_g1~~TRINITY_DN684_c0_g1_i2.p1  ORF type:complete len:169 (+),score=91.80 TRINITY_DN684_c0_g1_i2:59-565(+)
MENSGSKKLSRKEKEELFSSEENAPSVSKLKDIQPAAQQTSPRKEADKLYKLDAPREKKHLNSTKEARVFDRRSGTGRGNTRMGGEEKKKGAGRGNWGRDNGEDDQEGEEDGILDLEQAKREDQEYAKIADQAKKPDLRQEPVFILKSNSKDKAGAEIEKKVAASPEK